MLSHCIESFLGLQGEKDVEEDGTGKSPVL